MKLRETITLRCARELRLTTGPFSRLPRLPVSWILDTREECIFVMYERRENKRTGTKTSTADESSIVNRTHGLVKLPASSGSSSATAIWIIINRERFRVYHLLLLLYFFSHFRSTSKGTRSEAISARLFYLYLKTNGQQANVNKMRLPGQGNIVQSKISMAFSANGTESTRSKPTKNIPPPAFVFRIPLDRSYTN